MIKQNLTGKRIDRPTGSSPPAAADRSALRGRQGKISGLRSAMKSSSKSSGGSAGRRVRSASPKGNVVDSRPTDFVQSEDKLGLIVRTAEVNFVQEKVANASAHMDRLRKLLHALEAN